MAEILIIDDDQTLSSMLLKRLESIGHTVKCSKNLSDGFQEADEGAFDVIFLDVVLPDGNGLDYLPHFTSVQSQPEIIIMTGDGDPTGAEKAIKHGAWSYLEKPYVIRDLLLPLTRALEFREQKLKIDVKTVALKRDQIIGDSSSIKACLDKLAIASNSDANVLITGDTGTGKELFALAVHENSVRHDGPFVVVDCATLPDTLIESTLFGHTKGAYTGAEKSTNGLIQLADNGTLFLDEIGELPFDVQKKFLRVIQEGKYRPVGSNKEVRSNFRVVAATNRDLEQMCKDRKFRTDLLFRLRSSHIHLPPLNERLEDIPALARHLVSILCERLKIEQKVLASEFIASLQTHDWQGNVRELFQLIEDAFSRALQHTTLFAYHLPDQIRIDQVHQNLQNTSQTIAKSTAKPIDSPLEWKVYKDNSEREYLLNLMMYTNDSIQESCKLSGISRARIYQLLKKHGIKAAK